MNKIAKTYLEKDPWQIKEIGFNKERAMVSESLFSLANEYSGIRAFFDEGYSGPRLVGTYYNGVISFGEEEPNAYKGIAKRTHFTINSPNWVKCEFTLNGEQLDLNVSDFKNFERELDFRNGNYIRTFTWLVDDYELTFTFERLLNMVNCHEGAVRLTLSSNKDVEIAAKFMIDAGILHWGNKCYWEVENVIKEKDTVGLQVKTIDTNMKLTSIMNISGLEQATSFYEDKNVGLSTLLNLKKDETKVIDRLVINRTFKNNNDNEEELHIAKKELETLIKRGFAGVFDVNATYFADLFAKSDIEIYGDLENQQGIRYCLFQLEQTYHGYEEGNNIGAKGLTGEAYSGHAFWDSETYCLPYYLFTNKKAAKALLMFRYDTLEEAKKRALDLDCVGACFPIATRNGEEACTLWQHASLQQQPSTAVSYAIYHYMNIYKDDEFMLNYGGELIIEIAKFLLSRGQYASDGKSFGYYGVMGPDEFQLMVNNNTYTNFMAKETFAYLLRLNEEYDFSALNKKCGVDETFYKEIKKAHDKMIILYDEKTKLFEQHDGYYKLPHIDISSIPNSDFPLYSHWSYDRIYRNDLIKQPDVLMFMLLYNQKFTLEQLRNNYNFYEPRCIHESSLSPSVHSIIAAQIGEEEKAYDFFQFATRLDLDDYNNNTNEGIHMTSIAAAWMNIIYGFGGFRSDGEILVLNPTLPAQWEGYKFKLLLPEGLITVEVTKDSLIITNDGAPIDFKIYDEKVTLTKKVVIKR